MPLDQTPLEQIVPICSKCIGCFAHCLKRDRNGRLKAKDDIKETAGFKIKHFAPNFRIATKDMEKNDD
jgi:hypothetical protein